MVIKTPRELFKRSSITWTTSALRELLLHEYDHLKWEFLITSNTIIIDSTLLWSLIEIRNFVFLHPKVYALLSGVDHHQFNDVFTLVNQYMNKENKVKDNVRNYRLYVKCTNANTNSDAIDTDDTDDRNREFCISSSIELHD